MRVRTYESRRRTSGAERAARLAVGLGAGDRGVVLDGDAGVAHRHVVLAAFAEPVVAGAHAARDLIQGAGDGGQHGGFLAFGERRRSGEDLKYAAWTQLGYKLSTTITKVHAGHYDHPSTADRPAGETAAQRAYAYVKDRLLDGRFAGGTLLSENEIAHALGCSRTPVRQAFVELQGEGLLDLYPRRGGLVIPVSATDADDVLEARLLLEPYCARKAASVGAGL